MAIQGKVKWFDKSQGFITPDEGGKDVFFKYADIRLTGDRTLNADQRVEFDVIQTDKGLEARNVRPLGTIL